MGSRTAIAAGFLALALAAVPLAASPAAAQASDCERGGGLLSGVTNSLCDLVDGVTDVVDGVTGDAVQPVTDGLDDTTGDVLGSVGEVAPTAKPSSSSSSSTQPQPSPDNSGLLPETLDDVCLPVLACGDQSVLGPLTNAKPTATATATAGPTPTPTPTTFQTQDATVLPTEAPTPPESHPQWMDSDTATIVEEPVVVDDEPWIDLLWPNPLSDRLAGTMRDAEVVRPSESDSDLLGTGLTAVLLVSAILATRVMQQRRRREEKAASIPFEPMRVGGRHRLA